MIALMMAAYVASGPLATPPKACPAEGVLMTRGEAPALLYKHVGRERAQKLGDLPPAHLMLPVVRKVDGCAAPTVVRYNVQGDGRFAR